MTIYPIIKKHIHIPFYKGFNVQSPFKELPIGFHDMKGLIDIHKEKKHPITIALEGDPQYCMPDYIEHITRDILHLSESEFLAFKDRFHIYSSENGEKEVIEQCICWIKKYANLKVSKDEICIEETTNLKDVFNILKEHLIIEHYKTSKLIPIIINLDGKKNYISEEKNIIDDNLVCYTIHTVKPDLRKLKETVLQLQGVPVLIKNSHHSDKYINFIKEVKRIYSSCYIFQKTSIYNKKIINKATFIDLEKSINAYILDDNIANFIVSNSKIVQKLRFNVKLTRDFINQPLQIKLLQALQKYPHKIKSENIVISNDSSQNYFSDILKMKVSCADIRYVGGVTEAWYLTLKILIDDFYKRNEKTLKKPAILLYNQNYGYSVYTSSNLGVSIIPIPDDWNFHHLRNLFNKYEIICLKMENPHNPTGIVWDKDDILNITSHIMELKKVFPNIVIFDDLVYAGMEYSGKKAYPFAKIKCLQQCVITSISPSKLFGTVGLRAGFIHSYNKTFLQMIDKEIKRNGRRLNIYSTEIIKQFCSDKYRIQRRNYQNMVIDTYTANIRYVVDKLQNEIKKIKNSRVSIGFEYNYPQSGFFMLFKIDSPELKQVPYQGISKALGQYFLKNFDLLTLPSSTFTINQDINLSYSLRISIAYGKDFLDDIIEKMICGAKRLQNDIIKLINDTKNALSKNVLFASEHHSDINLRTINDNNIDTVLLNLINCEDIKNLTCIIPYVSNWNIADVYGKPLIFIALETQNIELINLLLSQNIDLSVKYKQYDIFTYSQLLQNSLITDKLKGLLECLK